MRSFSFIGAVALAAGSVSAQYSSSSTAPASTPVATSIPGGCNPAHPGSCPSSYFKTVASSAPSASKASASSAPAKSSTPAGSVTTTITAHAGCPTGPAPDVIVTRSDAPMPSCGAGTNATKASVVSMSGFGPSGSGSGIRKNGTMATRTMVGNPAQFTGAAGHNMASGALAVLAGAAVYLF